MKKLKVLIFPFIFFSLFFFFVSLIQAQTPYPLGPIGGRKEEGFGPWALLGIFPEVTYAANFLVRIISQIIGIMTLVAGILFLFQFIIAGYGYMTSSGDSKRMSAAYNKITSSLLGLVVIVAAYAIISLLGALLGFDILSPQTLIEKLKPGP